MEWDECMVTFEPAKLTWSHMSQHTILLIEIFTVPCCSRRSVFCWCNDSGTDGKLTYLYEYGFFVGATHHNTSKTDTTHHSVTQYGMVQHNTAQHGISWHSTVRHIKTQHTYNRIFTMIFLYSMMCCVVPWCAQKYIWCGVSGFDVMRRIVLGNVTLCCAVLCCAGSLSGLHDQ